MKLIPINITNFKIESRDMFVDIPKELWIKYYPSDENNLCNLALRSILIDNGDRIILIDNGFGDKQSKEFMDSFHLNGKRGLEESLMEHGYKTTDITDMILTHLHYDHCGGGVKKGSQNNTYEMTFPNAVYHVGKAQWDNAMNPVDREKESYLKENIIPMLESGQLNLIEKEQCITDGVKVRIYNGHTTGQIVPLIELEKFTVVFAADLIPTTAHIPLSHTMSYDINPLETITEKEIFLEEAFNKNYILFFQHDVKNECCTLQKTDKGIIAGETFRLRDILPL